MAAMFCRKRVRVLESALKHGLTEEEVLYAFENEKMYNTVRQKGNVNKEVDLLIGVLPDGSLCEMIATLSFDESEIVIFHAMKPPCKGFLKRMEGK